jgi:hypothetical protein
MSSAVNAFRNRDDGAMARIPTACWGYKLADGYLDSALDDSRADGKRVRTAESWIFNFPTPVSWWVSMQGASTIRANCTLDG